MSLGSLALWTGNFITAMVFPSLQLHTGAYAFLPFACISFSLALFLTFYLPETRGRIPADIAPLVSKGFKSKPLRIGK